MDEIIAYLAGAVPATMFLVALAKKVVKRFWPRTKLDPTVVLLLTAGANFAVAWSQFSQDYPPALIAVAAITAAYGAKVGYDATRAMEKRHEFSEEIKTKQPVDR